MTDEQKQTLKTHIANTPELLALATVADDAGLAAALNTPHTPGPKKDSRLTALGILDVLGPIDGATFLAGIQVGADAGNILLQMVNKIVWMVAAGGIDFGDARTWTQLDALVTAGVAQQAHVDLLKAYGTKQWSLAESILNTQGVVISITDAGGLR